MMSGSGYTALDGQNVSGSVPAITGPDHVTLKFSESNLQTFPPTPSDAQGKLSASHRPPTDADDTFSKPAAGSGSDESQQTGWFKMLSVAAYKPYFHVDTSDVIERIMDSLLPFKGNFSDKTSNNPDLLLEGADVEWAHRRDLLAFRLGVEAARNGFTKT